MKLYKISQSVNTGYDYTYRDGKLYLVLQGHPESESSVADWEWAPPEDVQVEYIGEAVPNLQAGVVCASYHAG